MGHHRNPQNPSSRSPHTGLGHDPPTWAPHLLATGPAPKIGSRVYERGRQIWSPGGRIQWYYAAVFKRLYFLGTGPSPAAVSALNALAASVPYHNERCSAPPYSAHEAEGATSSVRLPLKRPLRLVRRSGCLHRRRVSPGAEGWVLWVSGRWLKLTRAAGDDTRCGSLRAEAPP